MTKWRRPLVGGLLFAGSGAFWGAMNAGWLGLERDADRYYLQAWLGLGAGLVVVGFVGSGFCVRLRATGRVGRVARWMLIAAPILYILSAVIQFAIFGTLALGLGLVLLTSTMFRHRLVSRLDRWLMLLSAVGSVTWNTETQSVWFLVGVGLAWVVLAARLLPEREPGPT